MSPMASSPFSAASAGLAWVSTELVGVARCGVSGPG